jgi:hypothetical protein
LFNSITEQGEEVKLYKTLLTVTILISMLGLGAQTFNTWRIAERNTVDQNYTYENDEVIFFTDYYKETPHYSPSYPDAMDSITVIKRHQVGSNTGTWQHYRTIHMNPVVSSSDDFRTIKYTISNTSLGYNHRTEVYDNQHRLYQLTRSNFDPDLGNWYGQRTTYFYTQDNSLDSYVFYNNYSNTQILYTKSVPTIDNEGKKTQEVIYNSADSINWTPKTRHIFSYTGETYPQGFYFKPDHALSDFSMVNYWGTYARSIIPGLITPFVVDSIIVQSYENNTWVDEFYHQYTITSVPGSGYSVNIAIMELDMIPYPPDYFPPCLSFGINSNGLYSGHSISGDDGLSPPWWQSVSYTWQEISGLNEPTFPLPEIHFTTYPNPFVTGLTIKNENKQDKLNDISIYNVKGQLIRNWKGIKSAELSWDGTDASHQAVAPGIYLVKAQQGNAVHTQKVIKY